MKEYDNSLWTAAQAVPAQYPWLDKAESCDVLVIGGGVTGAMIAYRLASSGVNTVLAAADKIGFGETSVSPAFISGELEKTLAEMSCIMEQGAAVNSYRVALDAMEKFDSLSSELGTDFGYVKRDSLYYTSCEQGFEDLRNEYNLRKHNGFPVEFIDDRSSVNDFSFPIKAGIYTTGLAASINPYLLDHALIKKASENGARIYENTGITGVEDKNGYHTAFTDTRQCIGAKKIVVATGYDANGYIGGLSASRTLFNIASLPLPGAPAGWKNSCVIKNDSALTTYMSVTADNRITASRIESGLLTGNGKLAGCIPVKPIENRKFIDIESEMRKMLPGCPDISIDFRYTSCLKSTADGLPMIGEHDDFDGYYFALCAGAGGMLFSEIAGRYIAEMFKGKTPQDASLFCPNRFA